MRLWNLFSYWKGYHKRLLPWLVLISGMRRLAVILQKKIDKSVIYFSLAVKIYAFKFINSRFPLIFSITEIELLYDSIAFISWFWSSYILPRWTTPAILSRDTPLPVWQNQATVLHYWNHFYQPADCLSAFGRSQHPAGYGLMEHSRWLIKHENALSCFPSWIKISARRSKDIPAPVIEPSAVKNLLAPTTSPSWDQGKLQGFRLSSILYLLPAGPLYNIFQLFHITQIAVTSPIPIVAQIIWPIILNFMASCKAFSWYLRASSYSPRILTEMKASGYDAQFPYQVHQRSLLTVL